MDDAQERTDRHKRYRKLDFLGEGQFATVYKAEDLENNCKIVAVKKIKIGRREELADGINRTALREIKYLQELSHPNIIGLLDIYGHKSNISLVFDFMETDLEVIIKDPSIVLQPGHVKSYLVMTLQGLEYLHAHWILHRVFSEIKIQYTSCMLLSNFFCLFFCKSAVEEPDWMYFFEPLSPNFGPFFPTDLKPNNLLLDEGGVLKIADFGLARTFGSPSRVLTHQVVTRWYRAPELLFGARKYGVGVDMWAVGCILAELLLRVPFLPGDSDLDQLSRIFHTLGTPTEKDWPGMTSLPDYISFNHFPPVPLRDIFSAASDDLLDLIDQLLKFNPQSRPPANVHPYFSSKPPPTAPANLPKGSQHKKATSGGVTSKRSLSPDHSDKGVVKLIFSDYRDGVFFMHDACLFVAALYK